LLNFTFSLNLLLFVTVKCQTENKPKSHCKCNNYRVSIRRQLWKYWNSSLVVCTSTTLWFGWHHVWVTVVCLPFTDR